jgi:hypothetical protein
MHGCRNISVGIVPGYGALRPTVRSSNPGKTKNVLFSMLFREVDGPTQPPINGQVETLSPAIKRTKREADHPPPTSALMT